MKHFQRLLSLTICIMVAVLVGVNIFLFTTMTKDKDRPYMVEIYRLAAKMESEGLEASEIDYSSMIYVKQVILCETNDALTASSKYDYVVKNVGNSLYRFEYERPVDLKGTIVFMTNSILALTFLFVLLLLFYLKNKLIAPFSRMQQIPYELAKGNLTLDLEENKNRFFGKYIWGTNMLRESIEDRRKKELDLHREKKTLLLSLTHDIKTPLSVIQLNAQALSKGLYTDVSKQKQAASSIVKKVHEIEEYVTKMILAAREDFLHFEVKEEDFYLSSVIGEIEKYYEKKLELRKTTFVIEAYSDCILKGDQNRLIEVLQNLFENAMKYGDGEEIRLSFDKEEECRLISVHNTGNGIKTEELPHIFDSFYRGTNIGNETGSGLGLYICRMLMNQMNGDIFVKQQNGDFCVTLVVRES